MIMQRFENEMIKDLNKKGVFVKKVRFRRNLKTYELPVYDKAKFLCAIGHPVPDDLVKGAQIEVADAYPDWLRYKYPDEAEAILEAEFEASYQAFSGAMDKVFEEAR